MSSPKSRIYLPIKPLPLASADDRARPASARDTEVKAADGGLRIGGF